MEKRYCSAPWHGLHINPMGIVKTCCAGNPNYTDAISSTIDSVVNSAFMREVRTQMLDGILHPEYCSNCIHSEESSGSSERNWHNNINEGFDYASAGIDYLYPTLVDARWNTTCNQSCNYCDSANSSSWAAIQGTKVVSQTRHYTDSILDLIEQNSEKVVEVALVGGEPLLLKENVRVINALKDTKAKITIITNLNVDLETNPVYQALKEHHTVGWSLSFDNIGKDYEYVRYGGNWGLHENNIKQVVNLMQNPNLDHTGGIHAVYNLYNCTRLVEFKNWANDVGLTILWQVLHAPPALSVNNQNSAVTQLAINEINKYLESFDLPDNEVNFFNSILGSLTDPTRIEQSREYYKNWPMENIRTMSTFLDFIEVQSHPDTKGKFAELWPEIYQALGPI